MMSCTKAGGGRGDWIVAVCDAMGRKEGVKKNKHFKSYGLGVFQSFFSWFLSAQSCLEHELLVITSPTVNKGLLLLLLLLLSSLLLSLLLLLLPFSQCLYSVHWVYLWFPKVKSWPMTLDLQNVPQKSRRVEQSRFLNHLDPGRHSKLSQVAIQIFGHPPKCTNYNRNHFYSDIQDLL